MHKLAYPLFILMIIVTLAATVVAYLVAPETLPMQIGFDGEVNRYGSKNELILLGAIMVACNILMMACYAGCGKLYAMGMLNVPAGTKNPVKTGRIIVLACAVFCTILTIGCYILLLSAA